MPPKLLPGRRREDTHRADLPQEIKPGDYWKVLGDDGKPLKSSAWNGSEQPSNLTGFCWMIAVPATDVESEDAYMLGNLVAHTVREHEDGTISVLPGDGSSNSILVRRGRVCSWHGYVERGVLREC